MKNRFFSVFIAVAMMLSNLAVSYAASEFAGSGTEQDPYLIATANELVTLANLTNASATAADYADKYYKLANDIDMSGIDYKPVSYATNMYTAQGSAFKGTFDGNNHIIKNINMTSAIATYGATYGIIGYLGANGVVKNLGVENMTVDGGSRASRLCIGGIAGSLNSSVTIDSCYVRGMTVAVNATSLSDKTTYAAGIAGRTIGGSGLIKNCYSTNLDYTGVTSANNKAGILGSCGNTGYKAENCYTTDAKIQGNVSATNSYMGTTNCYSLNISAVTAEMLGSAYKENPTVKNEGYPVLSWESTEGYDMKEEVRVEDPYFAGQGTEEEPFEIDSAEKLTKLAELTNNAATAIYASKYYKLTADIDMTGIVYKPVSYASNMATAQGSAFMGTFDGNNHIIKNVTMTSSIAQYGATYGIIGYLGQNGVVKNLGVENMTVEGGSNASRLCVGGIAGSVTSYVTIESCYVKGMTVSVDPTVSDKTTYAGGIVGRTVGSDGIIKNCYAKNLDFENVTYASNKAGILGSCGNPGYKAENCYTTDEKIQGNTSATNSYMGVVNCYYGTNVELITAADLGDAFSEDEELTNDGNPILVWEYDVIHPETVTYTVKSGSVEIADGDKDIPAKNAIIITFAKEMNTDTFSKIQVLKGDKVLDNCTFEVLSDAVLSIGINGEYNTKYTLIIPKTVQSKKDENGKSAKADAKTITFRTELMPKAIKVDSVKINGQTAPYGNFSAGDDVAVEVQVQNVSGNSTQPVALIVTVIGQDGIMRYAALDTGTAGATSETLSVQFVIPENSGTNATVNVMVWDSVIKMNAMK